MQSQPYKEAREAQEGARVQSREGEDHVAFLLPPVRKLPNLQSVVGQKQKRLARIACKGRKVAICAALSERNADFEKILYGDPQNLISDSDNS